MVGLKLTQRIVSHDAIGFSRENGYSLRVFGIRLELLGILIGSNGGISFLLPNERLSSIHT